MIPRRGRNELQEVVGLVWLDPLPRGWEESRSGIDPRQETVAVCLVPSAGTSRWEAVGTSPVSDAKNPRPEALVLSRASSAEM